MAGVGSGVGSGSGVGVGSLPQAAKEAAIMTANSNASSLFIRFINLLSPFIYL